jgi:hypothetical protein
LSNSCSHHPDSDSVKNPSEGPRGFIFGTYSAAKEDLPEDKPLTKRTDQEHAYLSSTVGGSFSTLSFEDTHKGNRVSPSRNCGGGIRGKVTEFSGASRLTFLRCLASIDYTAFEGKIYYLTLTYPDTWPEDPQICKRHLEALRKRLQRKVGNFAGFWRLGVQARGAWHFHVLLFAPPSFGSLSELRQFVASSWYEISGRVSEGHLLAGTNVQEIRTWRRVGYVGRYMARPERFPEGANLGRVWGTWNKHLLPIRWETTKVSLEDAYRIRRVYRRLQKKKGTGTVRKVEVFVRHENVLKLLAFLEGSEQHPRGVRRPLPPRRPIPQRTPSYGRASRVSTASASRRNEEN